MAPRECSIRCADGKPGKSSGHLEAYCYRERSTNATGKTYRCQTGESLFLQNTDSLDIIHEPKCVMLYIQVYIQSVLFIRRTVGRFETCFHHTFAGPQFCCGLFGKITPSVITHSGKPVLQLFTTYTLCFSLHVVQHCIHPVSLRFANAFSYYGLVLLTTELFQEGGACGSESLLATQTDALTHSRTHTHLSLVH